MIILLDRRRQVKSLSRVFRWFWYIIVFRGADIGTGLAELSAAMIMVPMLIVLCSFFSGEIGACQATVIALTPNIPAVRGRRTAHEAASL